MKMFCTMHRWVVSRSMDSGRPLPGRTARHLAACRECKSFHRRCQAMESRLADEARRIAPEVSAELHEQILERCGPQGAARRPARPDEHTRRNIRWLWPTVALAAAAMVLLAVMAAMGVFTPETEPPGTEVAEDVRTDVTPIVPDAPGTARRVATALPQPMDEEIRLLAQDGRAAADFLIACVPLDIDLQPNSDTR